MLQYRFRLERLFAVPPEAFRPPPKVHSAVVRLLPRPLPELGAMDEAAFSAVVAKAFSKRRKTLRNALSGLVSESDLVGLGIDPGVRAQTLPVAAFVTIANQATQRRT
jgi:16S rRNA (adenine1518-N6/adenine1519-N6)-dimethyltransferase